MIGSCVLKLNFNVLVVNFFSLFGHMGERYFDKDAYA
jgi:hypothetical protein